jgi:hypothetical protein
MFDGQIVGFKGNIKGKSEGDGSDIFVPVETRFGIDPSVCDVIYED